MNRHYIVAALFLGIAACATSVPQSPESGAEPRNSATTRNSATPSNSATPASEIVVSDVPELGEVAIIPGQDEVVCSMERRTGTHRKVRVCRSRSQIARSAIEAKESFEILRRSQQDRQ